MNSRALPFAVGLAALLLAACASEAVEQKADPNGAPTGDIGDDDNAPTVAAPDDVGGGLHQTLEKDTTMRTTADVNLREGPSTDTAVLRVLPKGTVVTVLDPKDQNGFLNVEAVGLRGWVSVKYLEADQTTAGQTPPGTPTDLSGPPSPDNAIARAKPAIGFSYYWGGGAWLAEGPTSGTKGSCSGTCPNCQHRGAYGADCSGLVAKAWQFGDKDLGDNSHPYSTAHFINPKTGMWSDVNRANTKKGDALVHNSGGSGHIVLYEKGDPWGSPVVYECKGCSYGCVYNARAFGSNYKAIRRAGF